MIIIGGEDIYRLFFEHATLLELSEVETVVEGGDAHFPLFSEEDWLVIRTGPLIQEQDDEHPYRIVVRERISAVE